jgi:hypothetical protein
MDQLRWSLCPDARRRLVAANSGFDAESRWAELELWVGLAVMADRLSAPAKVCRAELADVARAAEQVDAALVGLHAPTCNALWTTLHRAGKLTQAASWFAQVRQDLGVLASVAREARDAIPGHGGRPPLELQAGAFFYTCAWVERLPPLPERAAIEVAISRNADKDLVHVPLEAPKDNLEKRCVESVKIILREVGLPPGRDVRAIVRKVRAKKPTQK